MNLISVAMFALNVNVDGNSRQARVNGRSDCVGVLCRVVACCVVLWCVVDVGVTFFALFLTKKRITFHDVCFSKRLTFHNDFMFFCFSQLFQALSETTSPTYFTSQAFKMSPVCTGNMPTCFFHVGMLPVHTGTF